MYSQRLLTLALTAGLAAYAAPAAAQGAQSTTPAASDTSRRMIDPVSRLLSAKNELKLTAEQTTKLEAIRSKFMKNNQARIAQLQREYAARDSMRKDDKSKDSRRALRASADSTRTEALAVLTTEQQNKLNELRREWRKEWKDDHGRRHGHGHDDHKMKGDSTSGM